MSDYTPTLAEVRRIFSAHALKSDRVRLSAEFDRFIAKVKADALREWADAQDSLIEKFPDWSNEAGRAESYRWTKAVRTQADRIESGDGQ